MLRTNANSLTVAIEYSVAGFNFQRYDTTACRGSALLLFVS